jgi:hypothetical protein
LHLLVYIVCAKDFYFIDVWSVLEFLEFRHNG